MQPYLNARAHAPNVFFLTRHCEPEVPHCRTLIRAPGESDAQFCGRAQDLCSVWSAASMHQARIELICRYGPAPADPQEADQLWMTKETARAVLARPGTPAEVRIEAIRLLNRLQQLVPAEVW